MTKNRVQELAEQLSKLTGAEWKVETKVLTSGEIYRHQLPKKFPRHRASLSIRRNYMGSWYKHQFQAMHEWGIPYGQMVRWLASITDMISMGFITVAERPTTNQEVIQEAKKYVEGDEAVFAVEACCFNPLDYQLGLPHCMRKVRAAFEEMDLG